MKSPSKWEIAILSTLLVVLIVPTISNAEASSGNYLPDSASTPGSLNSAVNQSTIFSTICVSGFTATIRPTTSFTTRLKEQQLRMLPYSAYGDTRTANFEEDHLISLELGGNATDPKNLWPEPWSGPYGAHDKDKLENKLHSLVCSNILPLATAQHLITTDWYSAYSLYVLRKSASPTPSATPTSTPTPSATDLSFFATWPTGATAKCDDGTYSYSLSRQGSCSHHQGVESFKQ